MLTDKQIKDLEEELLERGNLSEAASEVLLKELKWFKTQYTELLYAVTNLNDLLRSSYSIAQRRGLQTNWDAFKKRLEETIIGGRFTVEKYEDEHED